MDRDPVAIRRGAEMSQSIPMLAAKNRLRRAPDFTHVLRSGRRAGRAEIVVHVLRRDVDPAGPPRVGLVVGRSVGNSVTRHRVSRRLRAQLAHRLDRLPDGVDVVVRALHPAATSDSAVLGRDLDHVFARLLSSDSRR